jgi:hypothetical protein
MDMDTIVIIAIVIFHIAAFLMLYSIYLFIKHAQKKHKEQGLFNELATAPLPKVTKPDIKKQLEESNLDLKKELDDIPDLSHTIIDSALNAKFIEEEKSLPIKKSKLFSKNSRSPPPRAVHVSKNHDEAREAMQKAKEVLKHWEDEEHLVNYNGELDHIEEQLTKFYSDEKVLYQKKLAKKRKQETKENLNEIQRQEIQDKVPTKHLKSIHQEIYEDELRWVLKRLHTQTKDHLQSKKDQHYDARMQEIEDKIENLMGERKFTKRSANDNNAIPNHVAKFKEGVENDFDSFHQSLTSQQSKPKKSFLQKLNPFKKPQEEFLSEEQIEQRAVDLVKSISSKIEGDNPIPVPDISTISKRLITVHKQIWGDNSNPYNSKQD